MKLINNLRFSFCPEPEKSVCQITEKSDMVFCSICQKSCKKGKQWFDLLNENKSNDKIDKPEYLIGATNSTNWIKTIIREWHRKQEEKFLQRLLVVPDGHIEKIKTILQTHLRSQTSEEIPSLLLLDVGGGTGRWHFLSDVLNSHHVVVDIANPEYLELPSMITYCRGSADNLPFKNNVAAVITSFEMLEHCRFPEKVIQEMYRVLKPEGILVLTTRQYWKTHGSPHDYYRYTRFGLEEMMNASGLKVLKIIPMGGPASIIATVIDQNIPFLTKPLIKQISLYPLWWLATQIDRLFYLDKPSFIDNPDTTGWLIAATKV